MSPGHYSQKEAIHKTYLFHVFLPNLQLLLIRETDGIHTLKGIVVGISQPIGGRVSSGGKGLYLSSVGKVGSSAQVHQITTLVDSGTSSISNLGGQNLLLEGVVGKKLQSFFLSDDHTLKLLLLLDNLLYFLLDWLVCR